MALSMTRPRRAARRHRAADQLGAEEGAGQPQMDHLLAVSQRLFLDWDADATTAGVVDPMGPSPSAVRQARRRLIYG